MESSAEDLGRRRRRFTVECKRQIVEVALSPRTSVARVACDHQLNANLVFKWRRQYKQGLLGTVPVTESSLLPVDLVAEVPCESGPSEAMAGRIGLRIGRAHLRIQGCVDAQTLQTVLRFLVR